MQFQHEQKTNPLDERKAEIKNKKLIAIQERYYKKLYDISVMFSLVFYMDENIAKNKIEHEKIKISDNFTDGFTTIISTKDIINSSKNGSLYQTNHYQSFIAITSAFEVLIDDLINLFRIPEKKYKKEFSSSFYKENKSNLNRDLLKSHIIRKIISLHEILEIESVVLRHQELNIYYSLLKIRNKIVHQNGVITSPMNINYYNNLVENGVIKFSRNTFDDVLHRFMIPLKALFLALDNKLEVHEVQLGSDEN